MREERTRDCCGPSYNNYIVLITLRVGWVADDLVDELIKHDMSFMI